jgi:hypothetical protein
MKVDISSIVVIIVSLLFIILGGLSKRRKKSPSVKSNIQYKQAFNQTMTGKGFLKDAVTMINDPFDKLEKMFGIPEPVESQESESLEVEVDKEPRSLEVTDIKATSSEVTDKKASSLEVTTDKESQSLEVIVDEVAEYMKEKNKVKSRQRVGKSFDNKDLTKPEDGKVTGLKEKSSIQLLLFKDFDDFKKAVIYSEILNRKEY